MDYTGKKFLACCLASIFGITITSVAMIAVVSLSPETGAIKHLLTVLVGLVIFMIYTIRLAPGIMSRSVRLLEEREKKLPE